MTLLRRQASCFFAAFYRWNIHNHRTQQCSYIRLERHRGGKAASLSRQYHVSRSLRQQEVQQLQKDEVSRVQDEQREESAESSPGISDQQRNINDGAYRSDPAVLKEEIRSLMRRTPSSVAIITVRYFDQELRQHVPLGVAVSSLCTVSLEPPTISFNLKHPSKTLDAIQAGQGHFRVHFLGSDPSSTRAVELFSKGNHEQTYNQRLNELNVDMVGTKPSKACILGLDGVRAAIECTLTQQLKVADHVILVARVDQLYDGTQDDPGIMYFDGKLMDPSLVKTDADPHSPVEETRSK